MKTKTLVSLFALTSAFSLQPSALILAATPLGTAFTYQGRLAEGGQPANGNYELTFKLCTNASGGFAVAGPITNGPVAVSNGLFTTTVDFTERFFYDQSLWLEIAVRTHGSSAEFTALSPRQPLTPTPFGIYAKNAGIAGTASLAYSVGANAVGSAGLQDGSVSAGKIAGGHVVKSLNTLKDDVTLAAGANLTLTPSGQTLALAAGPNVALRAGGNAFTGHQTVTGGNVGIGTTSPQAQLDVNGTARVQALEGQPGQGLDVFVDSQRALRLEPTTNGAPNVIGGHAMNRVATGVSSATIGGGGGFASPHFVGAEGGTVGGGSENQVLRMLATVAGGQLNVAGGDASAVGGGAGNAINTNAPFGTIAGGQLNVIVGGVFGAIGGGIQNQVANVAATVGGGNQNTAGGLGATVSGGEFNRAAGGHSAVAGGSGNLANGPYGFVGGGEQNEAAEGHTTIGGGAWNTNKGWGATIGGGAANQVTNPWAAVGGGVGNIAGAQSATVGGGSLNIATGESSTIGGGEYNSASGWNATVPGGELNSAAGALSFAAGRRAKAMHAGSFVWADSTEADFESARENEFAIRASGGVRIEGAVTMGNTSDPSPPAGTMRWTGFNFEGYNGSRWVSLSSDPLAVTPQTNMVWIRPGSFAMGSPSFETDRYGTNEGPQTSVTISRGFWMGIYEVTQEEYVAMSGDNPSWFNGDRTAQGGGNYGVNLSRPVERVSWYDANRYCGLLTQQERTAGRLPANWAYRLPTEAEWEYACRAGTITRFCYGDDPNYESLTNYAWYEEYIGGTTHPVGQKAPNAWGLFDMHGNVYEWCQNSYTASYPGGAVTDPQESATGSGRPLRGGCFGAASMYLRSAYRVPSASDHADSGIGFRVVLAPRQP